MNKLCFLVIGIAAYGSLWPFDFLIPEGQPYWDFLNTIYRVYSPRDLVRNVILFIPVGFFGLLGARRFDAVPRQALLIMAIGIGVAFALQVAQIYVRLRVADLNDVFWNGVGLGIGVALAWVCWRISPTPYWRRLDMPVIPATLFGAWVVYRLAPFAPSFKLRWLKASLESFTTVPTLNPEVIIHDVVGWLVIAYLIATFFSPSRQALLIVMAGFFLAETLIIFNAITPSEIMAAVIAWMLWHYGLATIVLNKKGLLILLAGLLLVDVIWPLTLTNGFLVFFGQISADTAASKPLSILVTASDKIFLYGSFLYLLWCLSSKTSGSSNLTDTAK